MTATNQPRKWRRVLTRTVLVLGLLVAGGVGWVIVELSRADFAGAHPPARGFGYEESLGVAHTIASLTYTVNTSVATFKLDVAKPDPHCQLLFPSYAAAWRYGVTSGLPGMASVHLVRAKLKQFDDGLLATLDLALSDGTIIPGGWGKRQVLRRLLDRLHEQPGSAAAAARAHVAAALLLLGNQPAVPPESRRGAEAALAAFQARRTAAQAVGAWAWNDDLRRVFACDRFLMEGLSLKEDGDTAVVLAQTVLGDPELAAALRRLRALDGRLTNPPETLGIEALAGRAAEEIRPPFGGTARFALLAYSTSKEETMLSRLFAQGRVTEATDTMPLIVRAVRNGRVSLAPKIDSGWYDYQWFALETLLRPEFARESAKLQWSATYKQRLEGAFASALTGSRESQIKRLPVITMGLAGAEPPRRPVQIGPEFVAEPVATVYLRCARGYGFVRRALAAELGAGALRPLHRLREGQPPAATDLDSELGQMERLCYALYDRLCTEIGQIPQYEHLEITAADLATARADLAHWSEGLVDDPDLAADARYAVPITVWPGGLTRFWANGGVKLQRVEYRFLKPPSVRGPVDPEFVPRTYYLPTDLFVEFVRPGNTVLTRDEFRRLCDTHPGETSLRAALRVTQAADGSGWFGEWRPIARGAGSVLAGLALIGLWWKVPSSRRRLTLAGVLVAGTWITMLIVAPKYRVRWLVRRVAVLNTGFAMVTEARLLPSIPDAPRVAALAALLGDPDPQVRYLAARFLQSTWEIDASTWQQPGVREALLQAADDPDAETAAAATYFLGNYSQPETVAFLRRKLERDRHLDLRCIGILGALGGIHDPSTVESVATFGDDPRTVVGVAALRSLGRIGTSNVIPPLARFAASDRPRIRQEAVRSLQRMNETPSPQPRLTTTEFDTVVLGVVAGPDGSFQAKLESACALRGTQHLDAAFTALTQRSTTDGESSTAVVWRALRGLNLSDMRGCAHALGGGLSAHDRPLLTTAMQHGNHTERARLLVAAAIVALRANDPRLQEAALDALGALGPAATEALPAMKELRVQAPVPNWRLNSVIDSIERRQWVAASRRRAPLQSPGPVDLAAVFE